jgi:hypothetical protein
LKLTKFGKAVFVDQILSSHRLAQDISYLSLRWESVSEASEVRASNMPVIVWVLSVLLEYPVVALTYLAESALSSGLVRKLNTLCRGSD